MMILKELGIALFLGIVCSGILTVLFTNNLSTWYKTAKMVKKIKKENIPKGNV